MGASFYGTFGEIEDAFQLQAKQDSASRPARLTVPAVASCETMSVSGDSGYSVATTPDPQPFDMLSDFASNSAAVQDFRNEKVADTKSRLRDLMSSLSGASDKSLLLQTTALFETLLSKIHKLQDENEKLRGSEAGMVIN